MRRRTILEGAGVTLSVTLAGCGDLIEPIDDDSETGHEQDNGSDGSNEDGFGDDEPDSEPSDSDDDDDVYEDESIEGEVIVSEAASEYLSALRHTYTWNDDPPGDTCNVHVELENVGDEEIAASMEARIYDEEGAELASTHHPGETSPAPDDTATYSFPLSNCEGTAAYELEIDGPGDESDVSDDLGTLMIDDFEDYNSGGLPGSWTLDGTGNADVSSTAGLHEDSSQGLRQDGDSNVRSFPGQGLPNYPEDGREVSVLMRPDSNSFQPWILVGMEDDVWSTETPGWRLIIDPDGGIRIARETGSGAEILDENSTLPSLVDKTVDCRFIADSSDGVEFWVQDLDGSTLGSVSTSETDGIEDEMSIGFRSSQGVDWDWPRLVDGESGE
ncbi:hypothetical protein CV102_19425 [Natronococcus pandeyae]|uniref:CARDB domain-containing protein n=1 Tax=Natronococcus pandeyae TaxID=2055836 RepID=A0A8J8Q3D1_9EURY|nr:hypothetical protein [Natronococcus pandeyae]TYL36929.1 hypothetical protein CV102_19425 [Natronococcus pandeyae]